MILIDTQKEEFSKLKDIRIFGTDEEKAGFNGNLLVIGLGGAGSRVVASLKGMLMEEVTTEDNINYLMIDSDIPAMEQTIEDSKEGIGLNAMEVISIYRPNLEKILANGIENNPIHPNLAKWMSPDFPAISIGTDGARGNRQVGRLMFSNAYEDMRILLFERIEEIYKKSGKLDVIIVSSVCGGTGSGILSDVTYNVRAFAKSRKMKNFRVCGILMMPDVFFANRAIYENAHTRALLNANGCATLKEVDYLMRVANRGEGYVFESTSHRLSMRENIFDACMLVSGKKDDQGYIPEGTIFNDVAYFIKKLATFCYIGGPSAESEEGNADRKLLREALFDEDGKGYFKVVNESDYKIPIKEIENICEYEVFNEAFKRIRDVPVSWNMFSADFESAFSDIRSFLSGQPGEDINLEITGLIKMGQFEKPAYKLIKKGQDDLRSQLPRQLSRFEQNIPVVVKSLKNKLTSAVESMLQKCMMQYGPYITIDMIGAAGIGNCEKDCNLIVEIKKLEELQRNYNPASEYGRIVESILNIVAKRFFTFPSAKRETESGYYENSIKDALAKERSLLMDGLDSQDVFGDLVRLLRERAERLADIYSQFGEDLRAAVETLANDGKRMTGYLLKGARQREFLPEGYVTEERINQMREGIVALMVNHEADIDNGRVVPVRQEMEKIYRNLLLGVGVYAPEKLISVAFADKKPTLSEINMMFVSQTNELREEIMNRAANAFIVGASEKNLKKKLCILKEDQLATAINKKYISLPKGMPYFSKAVDWLLQGPPYNEMPDSITLNAGEMVISVDDMFLGVPVSMLACVDEMQEAYDAVDTATYKGLHIDETTKDMRSYPNLI